MEPVYGQYDIVKGGLSVINITLTIERGATHQPMDMEAILPNNVRGVFALVFCAADLAIDVPPYGVNIGGC